ncbi:hypothetical protein [Haliangium sp.]|uniref:hypothetical protein n=1 Tax=Haliangium sp. TaxID=2663208 RepID=UPI003D0E87B3
MGFFARAVISGFGFSLGKAIFDKVKDRVGLGETDGKTTIEVDAVEDADEADTGPATELESLDAQPGA